MITKLLIGLTALISASGLVAQEQDAFQAFQQALGEPGWISAAADHPRANQVFRPIPPLETFAVDAAKRNLGFTLFHDPRLSRDGTVACNTCHMGMRGGADSLPVSRGIDGALGTRNAPTVFNSAFNFRQFWDGRAADLTRQALDPIVNPVEMGHDLNSVVEFVASDPDYSRQFAAIYTDGVNAINLGNALAQHVKDMTRTDSRFNNYLAGDIAALTEQEVRGLEQFDKAGCTACHNGINLGGNSYQALGGATDYLPADPGLYARSGREADRGAFKVPSLHNVALTAPYFHDGKVATLEEAVRRMAQLTSGASLDDQTVADIMTFLNSLSSEFFASMAPRMNSETIRGEMRQQLQMDHSMHNGGDRAMQGNNAAMMHQQHSGMNHAMHQQHTGNAGQETTSSAPAQTSSSQTDHSTAYTAALTYVLQAEQRITSEMERIQQGEVAHYDFLQFEYSEFLRHARALAFPPATIVGAQRQTLTNQAAMLLQKVESLEWMVADFLRAEAARRGAFGADVASKADSKALMAGLSSAGLTQSAQAVQATFQKPGD